MLEKSVLETVTPAACLRAHAAVGYYEDETTGELEYDILKVAATSKFAAAQGLSNRTRQPGDGPLSPVSKVMHSRPDAMQIASNVMMQKMEPQVKRIYVAYYVLTGRRVRLLPLSTQGDSVLRNKTSTIRERWHACPPCRCRPTGPGPVAEYPRTKPGLSSRAPCISPS